FSQALRRLMQAPHRMFFFTGMWQLVVLAAWWALVLTGRVTGISAEPVLPALFMHGGAVLFLMFTPFMAGFLLTVMPRWQAAPEFPLNLQRFVFVAFNLGQLLFFVGMYGSRWLVALGL